MLRSLEEHRGYVIEARDGAIGMVHDFYFDDATWTVRYLVVETKRFFGPEVLIVPESITGVDDGKRTISVSMTRDRVRNSPPVDTARPISRQYQRIYLGYYGLPTWWGDAETSGILPPAMAPAGLVRSEEDGDPHLRSAKEVRGYLAIATDGRLGDVKDFIADDRWRIRHLVVDTRRWWFGRWVLIRPTWVRQIDWAEHVVHLTVSRTVVRQRPEWRAGQSLPEEEAPAAH